MYYSEKLIFNKKPKLSPQEAKKGEASTSPVSAPSYFGCQMVVNFATTR